MPATVTADSSTLSSSAYVMADGYNATPVIVGQPPAVLSITPTLGIASATKALAVSSLTRQLTIAVVQ